MKTEVENSKTTNTHSLCWKELICICIKSKLQQPSHFGCHSGGFSLIYRLAASDDKLPAAFLERKKRLEHIVKLLRHIKQKQMSVAAAVHLFLLEWELSAKREKEVAQNGRRLLTNYKVKGIYPNMDGAVKV